MIDPKIETAVNAQINQEFSAAHTYLQMAAHFDQKNLDGFAHWMMTQHQEELAHAMRLYRYVLDRGGAVTLGAIEKPRSKYASTLDVFKAAREQELANTRSINELYRLAKKLDDFATISHLQWFLDEQVEEEKIFDEAINLLELAGDDRSALLMLNEKFGQRTLNTGGPDAQAGQ